MVQKTGGHVQLCPRALEIHLRYHQAHTVSIRIDFFFFLQSVDLKEIRAKHVFDPYVKWPFWLRTKNGVYLELGSENSQAARANV